MKRYLFEVTFRDPVSGNVWRKTFVAIASSDQATANAVCPMFVPNAPKGAIVTVSPVGICNEVFVEP